MMKKDVRKRRYKKKLVKRYVEGYRKKPEDIREIKAIERACAEAFKNK